MRIRQTENSQKWTRGAEEDGSRQEGEEGRGRRQGEGGTEAAQQNRPTAWLQVADEKPAGDSSGSVWMASKGAPRFKSLAQFCLVFFKANKDVRCVPHVHQKKGLGMIFFLGVPFTPHTYLIPFTLHTY